MDKIFIKTKDNQRISILHYKSGYQKVIVLAHGFFNNKDVYLFNEISKQLAIHYDVISFDFRGHGKSSGLFSWTTKENYDLQAVLAYLNEFNYEAIALMGFSLGANVCLIEASQNKAIKAVVSVSAPYDFWQIDYHFWQKGMLEDLRLNLGDKGKGKRVLLGNPFGVKIAPINVVDKISPCPILFIHGNEDWLINVRHVHKLFNKAKQPKAIEIINHGGHAEKLYDDHSQEFMKIVLDWLKEKFK